MRRNLNHQAPHGLGLLSLILSAEISSAEISLLLLEQTTEGPSCLSSSEVCVCVYMDWKWLLLCVTIEHGIRHRHSEFEKQKKRAELYCSLLHSF